MQITEEELTRILAAPHAVSTQTVKKLAEDFKFSRQEVVRLEATITKLEDKILEGECE